MPADRVASMRASTGWTCTASTTPSRKCWPTWTAPTRRLRGEPAPDRRAAAALLRETARRTAAVEADPGWIDARLSLDEVSIDVRRAGLDLDPGWLAWLGVVVRFVYE